MFQKTTAFRIFFWVSLILIGFFIFFPLLWLINTALKPTSETFSSYFFVGPLTLDNIIHIVTDPKIMGYLKNSLIVSFGSSLMATIVCAFAGYSFAKFRYRGRKFVMGMFMMSQAFPQAILLLSIYSLMNKTGLLGSYWALLISYVVFTLPVGTWTLKSYFDNIPDSLIESAKIDGAGHWRIMTKIVFPMVVPGMTSIAIYGFVWSWNDLLYSMTLVTDTAKRTLASGLVMTFLGEASTNWGYMMAASTEYTIVADVALVKGLNGSGYSAGVTFQQTDGTQFYHFRLDHGVKASSQLLRWPDKNSAVAPPAKHETEVKGGQAYRLRVTVSGEKIIGYVDSVKPFEYDAQRGGAV